MSVKQSMLHDWGSRDATFIRINREVLEKLPTIINGGGPNFKLSREILGMGKTASQPSGFCR